MKRKQPFWVRLFSPVKLKTQRIDKAGSHPRVRLAAFNVFVGIGSFLVAFLLGSVLMIPGESSAEDISTLSNDASLSVALTPEAMNLAVTPTPDGTLASDEMAIQVSTDHTAGYTLTLALAGTESSLYDSTSGGEIQSTTAAMRDPNTLAVNTWGWYPDSLANNTGNLFSALPSNSDPYELKKTSAPTSGSGDTTTISFGVNVDTTLPAGSYTNAIVISAVTNYVPQPILDVYPTTGWAGDSITLYSNGGFVNVQSVTIGGTNCTSINVKSADELTCTLPSKAETDTTSGTDNGYSISVIASNTSLDTHNFTIRYFNPNRTETASVSNTQITNTNMSSFTGVDCGSLSVGDIVSLTDERNGQTYRIKKMQDNKCWMVDNLKYAGEANTDLANVDGTYGLVYNNESGKYNTVDGTSTQSSTNSDKAFYNNPMVGSYCYGTSIQSSYTKCGYLYNWYAATEGSGTYATSTDGTNVSGSICPTGWNLPTSAFNTIYNEYSGADFAVLNASMNAGSPTSGSTSSYSYYAGWQFTGAWSGVFSGYWSNGFSVQGSQGYYWSSTASSSTYATGLYFNNSYVSTDSIGNKVNGRAIRCVKENTITIYFDGNGADGGEMKPQHIHVGNIENLNLNTYTTSASGYAFGGWNTMPDGSGITYTDGAAYKASINPSDSPVFLYAQWLKEVGYIQDFTKSQCQEQSLLKPVIATDIRDANTYTLRFINGNCWMTQNLRIASGTMLTSSNSNVISDYTIPYVQFEDGTHSVSEGQVRDFGNIDYGYYYNFCAATAGTSCRITTSTSPYSICPAGWRLPSRTEINSLTNDSAYSAAFAPSPVPGGYYYDGRYTFVGENGQWWSSSRGDADGSSLYAIYYKIGSNMLTTTLGSNTERWQGLNIRCIRAN